MFMSHVPPNALSPNCPLTLHALLSFSRCTGTWLCGVQQPHTWSLWLLPPLPNLDKATNAGSLASLLAGKKSPGHPHKFGNVNSPSNELWPAVKNRLGSREKFLLKSEGKPCEAMSLCICTFFFFLRFLFWCRSFLFLFLILFLNWKIIALQCCVGFQS